MATGTIAKPFPEWVSYGRAQATNDERAYTNFIMPNSNEISFSILTNPRKGIQINYFDGTSWETVYRSYAETGNWGANNAFQYSKAGQVVTVYITGGNVSAGTHTYTMPFVPTIGGSMPLHWGLDIVGYIYWNGGNSTITIVNNQTDFAATFTYVTNG